MKPGEFLISRGMNVADTYGSPVRGYVSAIFGVHREDCDDHPRDAALHRVCGRWRLTHLRTGGLVGAFRRPHEARRAAKALEPACNWDFGQFGAIDRNDPALIEAGRAVYRLFPGCRDDWSERETQP